MSQDSWTRHVYHCRILIRRVNNSQQKFNFECPNINQGYNTSMPIVVIRSKFFIFRNFSILDKNLIFRCFTICFCIIISRTNANSCRICNYYFWFSMSSSIKNLIISVLLLWLYMYTVDDCKCDEVQIEMHWHMVMKGWNEILSF